MKNKLIASTVSMESMIDFLCNRYFFSVVTIDDQGIIHNSKGPIEGLRVVKLKNRFRLELLK
jgi:hypothetical protein